MARAIATVVWGIIWFFAAACGAGDAVPSATPSAEPQPGGTATSGGATGISNVDAVIAALLSGESTQVRSVVGFVRVPCEVEPQGLGAPPACRRDEARGTPVEVFQVAECEGYYLRPEQMESAVESIVSAPLELYAVFRSGDRWPEGAYVAVFATDVFDRPENDARAAVIADGRMVGFHFGCAMTPEGYLEFYQVTAEELVFLRPGP